MRVLALLIDCGKSLDTFVPPFFLPFWDPDAYYASIDKLKQIDYDTLCLAHYGYIYGDEAKGILDESVTNYEQWWQLFEKNVDKLDDVDYMVEVVLKEMNPDFPDLEILSLKLKVLFGLMTGWSKLVRKSPQPIGGLLRETLGDLITAYKTYSEAWSRHGQVCCSTDGGEAQQGDVYGGR